METKRTKLTGRRGQAAIFDGITLLLLASVSAALIFAFVSGYGTQQDRVLRSAYILNYMQSVVKASYYIDASTLSKVNNQEKTQTGTGAPTTATLDTYADLADPKEGCRALSKYSGSFSVSELLKRDLSEPDAILDDSFETTPALGITAYKCAVKELMKPFWYAGFYYGFDVLSNTGQPVRVSPKTTASYANSRLVTDFPAFLKAGVGSTGICQTANVYSPDVVTVNVPFKIVYVNTQAQKRDILDDQLQFCIWQPGPNAKP